jgi:hypothetical protein
VDFGRRVYAPVRDRVQLFGSDDWLCQVYLKRQQHDKVIHNSIMQCNAMQCNAMQYMIVHTNTSLTWGCAF